MVDQDKFIDLVEEIVGMEEETKERETCGLKYLKDSLKKRNRLQERERNKRNLEVLYMYRIKHRE